MRSNLTISQDIEVPSPSNYSSNTTENKEEGSGRRLQGTIFETTSVGGATEIENSSYTT